jgi:hypothetical protein|uniref:Uncharacterized protein n=1 Tax=viral metagenome TaxID=1070528 RepID=A0A6C0BK53_9ZZZZ
MSDSDIDEIEIISVASGSSLLNEEEPDGVCAPQPDPLKLIIVTCKTYLNCNLNLEMIAHKLPLDSQIIGKKLLGVVEEGQIKSRTKANHKKTAKNGRKTTRKDFSNQCTVIIQAPMCQKKLNLKIFGNGKIVITGGFSEDDGREAVNILRAKIATLTDQYQIHAHSNWSDLFESIPAYLKYISKNYLIFLKMFSLYDINVDLRLDLVLNKKFVENYLETDLNARDPVKKGLCFASQPEEIDKFLRMIQIFNICHLYFPNTVLLDKLNQLDPNLRQIINQLYLLQPQVLPLTFDLNEFNRPFDVTIENYNTMFNCRFHNNRELFTQILNDRYKSSGLISSAKFEPSNYQGINVKYVSRILCQPCCTSMGKKKNSKCRCKEVSFLIFQEGNIIITGGRSWEQLLDGYRVITQILKTEYPLIHVKKNQQTVVTTQPTQIVQQDTVYLNRKTFINENPRNVYLIKTLGLLDNYLV